MSLMDPAVVPESDATLLAAFAERREEAAFTELVRRHGGMVLSVCRSVLGDAADAEEAAQAVFLTLAQKANSPTVQAHVVGWLHRVAWYVAARAAEARATRRRHEREAARMRTETDPSPSEAVDLEALHASLGKLPERYRVPLILYHLEGRSQEDTAAMAGCSVTAVAVRLHRGREMLRSRLSKRGASASSASLAAGAWGLPSMKQMSAEFAARTTKAAIAVTGSSVTTTAVVSPQAAALAKQAMAMLFSVKRKAVATLLFALLLLGGVVITAILARPTDPPPAAAAVVPPPPPAPARPMQTITGMITRVDNGSLDILRRNKQTVPIGLNAATVVTVDNKLATLADLKTGMSTAVLLDEGQPATEIRAYTALGPGPAK